MVIASGLQSSAKDTQFPEGKGGRSGISSYWVGTLGIVQTGKGEGAEGRLKLRLGLK